MKVIQTALLGVAAALIFAPALEVSSVADAQPVNQDLAKPNVSPLKTVDPNRGGTHGSTGHLLVFKQVINLTGGPAPSTFSVTPHCGLFNAPFQVTAGQNTLSPFPIAAGSICSPTETPPSPVAHATGCGGHDGIWSTTITPQSVTIVAGGASQVHITNTLSCDPGPAGFGSLKVIKSAFNMTGGPATLPGSYPMTVTCPGSTPAVQSISVPNWGNVTVSGIRAPGTCTVTENPPSAGNAEACHGPTTWRTYIAPASIPIYANAVSTVSVRNELICK